MLTATLSIRLSRWRESFGFLGDPFDQFEADQERNFLPRCFVDRPYLHNMLGDPSHPQTAILSAAPGGGKSATREMIVYECLTGKLHGKVLPIRYDTFEYLHEATGGNLTQSTLKHHIFSIARLLFKTLKEDVPATYFDRLDSFNADLLLTLAATYADPIINIWLRRVLPNAQILEGLPQTLSPAETLHTLVGLVCNLGSSQDEHFQAVFILVDRIDEIIPEEPVNGVQAIRPLISENALINREKLAFKIFIPNDFTPAVRNALPISAEKVVFEKIDWDPQILPKVINQRLWYFSDGKIESYEQLFAPDLNRAKTIERLVDKAVLSPRTLIKLFKYMVYSHLERDEKVSSSLLDRSDLNTALARYDQEKDLERSGQIFSQVSAAESLQPAPVHKSGLFLDQNEHIWIDGQMLQTSLSRQEFSLLKELHKHQSNIVSTEQLIYAIWPESRASSEDPKGAKYDEQNLRKLIDRLREKLATPERNEKERFIRNARGRGYWLAYS